MRQRSSIATPSHHRHAAPPALPAAARAVLPGRIHLVRYLGTGSAHAHWRIDTDAGRFVWRAVADPGHTPGASEAAEAAALTAIAGQAWAPRLITHLPGQGWLFHHAPGHPPDPATLDAHQRAALIEALLACWSLPCHLPPRDYTALVCDYARRAQPWAGTDRAHDHSCPTSALVDRLLAGCANWQPTDFRFTHHDLHPGNLLLAGRHWTLLDWEYAGLGNPWFDAAALDAMLGLGGAERARIEAALGPPSHPLGWAGLRAWHDDLARLWARARKPEASLP